ncbi:MULTISPECIES: hypothetical protein [Providencia]
MLKLWGSRNEYYTDCGVELDNNITGNALRCAAIDRKN